MKQCNMPQTAESDQTRGPGPGSDCPSVEDGGVDRPGRASDEETWVDCELSELHEVSDQGRVRNARTGRILKAYLAGRYLAFKTRMGGKNVYVHVAVATAFHGPRPQGLQAAHLNGNRWDNRAANLAWVTAAENHRHKVAHGTTHRGKRFISLEKEERVRLLLDQKDRLGLSLSSIGRLSGVSTWSIERIAQAPGVRVAV